MIRMLRPALVSLGLFTLLTGLAYPLAMTALARLIFPRQAAGSLIEKDGVVIGSSLIGQSFDDPKYFWSRLSATSPAPYNGDASSGSNFGPLNPTLLEAVGKRVAALRASEPGDTTPIPVDLATASGSGLDPHISPAAAYRQVARVARARGMRTEEVRSLVTDRIEGRQLGILGEPRVNVLLLNLALDRVQGR